MKTIWKLALLAAGVVGAAAAAQTGVKLHRIAFGKVTLPEGFTVTAHSGCEGTPDNSLEYIEKALALQVPVLEVDVCVRNDGTPVLLHAQTAGDGEGVLLEDALRRIAEASAFARVNLDLKAFTNIPGVYDVLVRTGMLSRCFFTGVTAEHTQLVKIDAPGVPYYLNAELNRLRLEDRAYLEGLAHEVLRSGAVGLNCSCNYASKTLIDVFRKANLKVSFWTADNKFVQRNLLTMGPDNITTRRPVLLQALIEQG